MERQRIVSSHRQWRTQVSGETVPESMETEKQCVLSQLKVIPIVFPQGKEQLAHRQGEYNRANEKKT